MELVSISGKYKGNTVQVSYNPNDDLFYAEIGDNEYIPLSRNNLKDFGIDSKDVDEYINTLRHPDIFNNEVKQKAAINKLLSKYNGVVNDGGQIRYVENGKKLAKSEHVQTPYYVNIDGEPRAIFLSRNGDTKDGSYTLTAIDSDGNHVNLSNKKYNSLNELTKDNMPQLSYHGKTLNSYDNKEAVYNAIDAVNNPRIWNGDTSVDLDTGGIDAIKANAPALMSASELAKLYGLNYDYDYILNVMNEGTDAYLNEMTEKAKQLQQDTLRNQTSLYYQYLNNLREQRANAVNTGINRGAQAAQELSQYLLTQQEIGKQLSESNATIYDLYNQAITERAKNKYNALKDYNQLGSTLMTGSINLNANDVQRYTADLGAAAQIAAARADAAATIKSSLINAQTNKDIAYDTSPSNPRNKNYYSSIIKANNADAAYKNSMASNK